MRTPQNPPTELIVTSCPVTHMHGQYFRSNSINYYNSYSFHLSLEGMNYFIGATSLESHGTWRWMYSRRLVNSGYSDWYPGKPDNYNGHQWCIVLWEDHHWTWNDQSCTDPEGFVCETNI